MPSTTVPTTCAGWLHGWARSTVYRRLCLRSMTPCRHVKQSSQRLVSVLVAAAALLVGMAFVGVSVMRSTGAVGFEVDRTLELGSGVVSNNAPGYRPLSRECQRQLQVHMWRCSENVGSFRNRGPGRRRPQPMQPRTLLGGAQSLGLLPNTKPGIRSTEPELLKMPPPSGVPPVATLPVTVVARQHRDLTRC